MAWSNSTNLEWNTNHNDARCPVNDTDLDGAPFALGGAKGEWEAGSANTAVIATANASDIVIPTEDATIDLKALAQYVNKEMMYGYNADARYLEPVDLMAYRGYPTSIVVQNLIALTQASSEFEWTVDGSIGSTSSRYSIFEHQLTIKFKVGYDIQYQLTVSKDEVTTQDVELLIASGSLSTTHYRLVGDVDWILLPTGKAYFTINTFGDTEDFKIRFLPTNFIQTPHYGNLVYVDYQLDFSEYDTTPANSLGLSYYVQDIFLYKEYIVKCSEVPEFLLDFSIQLYLKEGDNLEAGTTVYTDEDTLNTALQSGYIWVEWSRFDTLTNQNIYRVLSGVQTNDSGVLLLVHTADGYEGEGCYVPIT